MPSAIENATQKDRTIPGAYTRPGIVPVPTSQTHDLWGIWLSTQKGLASVVGINSP